ncbi:hypothetical protein SAMN04487911_10662 [Arenibacter nanhaiticus]|uniref:Uncharacterized protein n=1 Tax=Arenibacter nanhaiticus TaxID=558155 RepID=A0A1M6E827_9FLAO|nr:hypothetical protein [Arenibacter nanhaiticus]SHI81647.1 hypothetical protein SAMN04487911_10662 [Arenibacter nanhaiticus]
MERTPSIKEIAKGLGHITINITYYALNSKAKNRTDEKLAQLFAASLTFIDSNNKILTVLIAISYHKGSRFMKTNIF